MNRRGQRRAANVGVRLSTRPATIGAGIVTNISPTGAFLETHMPLSLLSLVYLEPTDPSLAGTPPRGHLAATVVRLGSAGVGLEWCEFGAEMTEVYARLADGANDMVDPQQLSLPAMPDAATESRTEVPHSFRPDS